MYNTWPQFIFVPLVPIHECITSISKDQTGPAEVINARTQRSISNAET